MPKFFLFVMACPRGSEVAIALLGLGARFLGLLPPDVVRSEVTGVEALRRLSICIELSVSEAKGETGGDETIICGIIFTP